MDNLDSNLNISEIKQSVNPYSNPVFSDIRSRQLQESIGLSEMRQRCSIKNTLNSSETIQGEMLN